MALRDSAKNKACYAGILGGKHEQKRWLSQRNYNLHLSAETPLKGCKSIGTTFGADFDLAAEGKTPEQLQAEVLQMADAIVAKREEAGLLMCEKSRKGCHAVFRRVTSLSLEENLRRVSGIIGYEFDPHAKDEQRCFFTPPSTQLVYIQDELYESGQCAVIAEEKKVKAHQTKKVKPAAAKPAKVQAEEHLNGQGNPLYKALEFSFEEIGKKWWEMNGGLPAEGERNARWFEFVCAISYFTADSDTLRQACAECTLDTAELDTLIANVVENYAAAKPCRKLMETMDALLADSKQDYRLPRGALPKSFKTHTLPALPRGMDMPATASLTPLWGAYATGVEISYDSKVRNINLASFISGVSGSGKGAIADVVMAWSQKLRDGDKEALAMEEEWRQLRRTKGGGSKELPPKPNMPVRMPTMNSTLPQVVSRIAHTGGLHAFSFCEEADEVTSRLGSGCNEFSSMLRKSYDGAMYERETVGADGINVHVDSLRWNAVFCGTPDALARLVPNVTDGLANRLYIATTPDNTFAKQEKVTPLTNAQKEYIQRVCELLMLMKGRIQLPKLEKTAQKWVEDLRQESAAQNDRVLARARMRAHTTAFRATVSILLVCAAEKLMDTHGFAGAKALLAQEPGAWIPLVENMQKQPQKELFCVIADSVIYESMRYFRTRISMAYASANYQTSNVVGRRVTGNEDVFAKLPQTFTMEQVYELLQKKLGAETKRNTASSQIKRWKNSGRIVKIKTGYEKV